MGRRKKSLPEAGKRMIRGAWSVHWWYEGKMFSVALGYSGAENEMVAETIRRTISSALADKTPFPQPYDKTEAYARYLELKTGIAAKSARLIPPPDQVLSTYDTQMSTECDAAWARGSRLRLSQLHAATGNILATTPAQAQQFLTDILTTRKPATRNRALVLCNRFFKWALHAEYVASNPFAGIKLLREERRSDRGKGAPLPAAHPER